MLNRQHNSDTLCLARPVYLLFTIHIHIYAFFAQKSYTDRVGEKGNKIGRVRLCVSTLTFKSFDLWP